MKKIASFIASLLIFSLLFGLSISKVSAVTGHYIKTTTPGYFTYKQELHCRVLNFTSGEFKTITLKGSRAKAFYDNEVKKMNKTLNITGQDHFVITINKGYWSKLIWHPASIYNRNGGIEYQWAYALTVKTWHPAITRWVWVRTP